jgi:peptidoglycan-N-acetylglucosamine deacetylase
MKPYWIKTPYFIKRLFHNQIWSLHNSENKVYLTFDDGPTPQVTDWVLNILKRENIKATFFCIGKNIVDHPELFDRIINENHSIGNHTFNHCNGWKTNTKDYIENVNKCNQYCKLTTKNLALFRPPYGKIKYSQSKELRKLGYKIMMWDVLSADFDQSISPEKCFKNATQKVTNGSIIVFHDSAKAYKNLEYVLPKTIEILKEKGFIFDKIT